MTEQEWRNKMEEKQKPDNKFKAGVVTRCYCKEMI